MKLGKLLASGKTQDFSPSQIPSFKVSAHLSSNVVSDFVTMAQSLCSLWVL